MINAERTAHCEPALAFGVALHRGQVMYGNIGARDRLDFTVISSAVNEASRLEGLCKALQISLALSQGVRAPIHVFTRRSESTR